MSCPVPSVRSCSVVIRPLSERDVGDLASIRKDFIDKISKNTSKDSRKNVAENLATNITLSSFERPQVPKVYNLRPIGKRLSTIAIVYVPPKKAKQDLKSQPKLKTSKSTTHISPHVDPNELPLSQLCKHSIKKKINAIDSPDEVQPLEPKTTAAPEELQTLKPKSVEEASKNLWSEIAKDSPAGPSGLSTWLPPIKRWLDSQKASNITSRRMSEPAVDQWTSVELKNQNQIVKSKAPVRVKITSTNRQSKMMLDYDIVQQSLVQFTKKRRMTIATDKVSASSTPTEPKKSQTTLKSCLKSKSSLRTKKFVTFGLESNTTKIVDRYLVSPRKKHKVTSGSFLSGTRRIESSRPVQSQNIDSSTPSTSAGIRVVQRPIPQISHHRQVTSLPKSVSDDIIENILLWNPKDLKSPTMPMSNYSRTCVAGTIKYDNIDQWKNMMIHMFKMDLWKKMFDMCQKADHENHLILKLEEILFQKSLHLHTTSANIGPDLKEGNLIIVRYKYFNETLFCFGYVLSVKQNEECKNFEVVIAINSKMHRISEENSTVKVLNLGSICKYF